MIELDRGQYVQKIKKRNDNNISNFCWILYVSIEHRAIFIQQFPNKYNVKIECDGGLNAQFLQVHPVIPCKRLIARGSFIVSEMGRGKWLSSMFRWRSVVFDCFRTKLRGLQRRALRRIVLP